MPNDTLIFSLFGGNTLAQHISEKLHIPVGEFAIHTFPDEETLITIQSQVENKKIILLALIDRPNTKLTTLFMMADTLRALGAKQIGLVAPYLPYMRQDKQFHPGEGITSAYFANWISARFDWLMTIDPHLHRYPTLNAIYTLPTFVLHATKPLAAWIKQNVVQPLLIGPDKESEQWVAEIAKQCEAPFLIVEKTRLGDNDVKSTLPEIAKYPEHTCVIIDDIIASGETILETIKHCQHAKRIVCLGVHAIFAGRAYQNLLDTHIDKIITCNTVQHRSNQIDMSELISDALRDAALR